MYTVLQLGDEVHKKPGMPITCRNDTEAQEAPLPACPGLIVRLQSHSRLLPEHLQQPATQVLTHHDVSLEYFLGKLATRNQHRSFLAQGAVEQSKPTVQ
jgi:hypothetical protein